MTVGIVLGASPTTAHMATAANNILIVTSLRQGFRPLANETVTPGPRLEPSPSTLPGGERRFADHMVTTVARVTMTDRSIC